MPPRLPIKSDHDGILELLRELGWHARVTKPSRFNLMMQSSELSVVAEDKGRIIGFGYAISDRVANGFITLLGVHPMWRNKGIGLELAKCLIAGDPQVTWLLRASEDLRPFWRKIGFKASQFALERERELPSSGISVSCELLRF